MADLRAECNYVAFLGQRNNGTLPACFDMVGRTVGHIGRKGLCFAQLLTLLNPTAQDELRSTTTLLSEGAQISFRNRVPAGPETQSPTSRRPCRCRHHGHHRLRKLIQRGCSEDARKRSRAAPPTEAAPSPSPPEIPEAPVVDADAQLPWRSLYLRRRVLLPFFALFVALTAKCRGSARAFESKPRRVKHLPGSTPGTVSVEAGGGAAPPV